MNLDWHRDMNAAPRDKAILLLLGETIPEMPDIRVGGYITADAAMDMGEFDVVSAGGWLIWNSADDWFVVNHASPMGWCSLALPDLRCWPVWRRRAAS